MGETFGDLLRRYRGDRPQAAIAEAVGLSLTYYNKIENSKLQPPSSDTIERLASALGVDADVLFAAAGRLPPDLEERLTLRPELWPVVRSLLSAGPERIREVRALLSSDGEGELS